MGGRYYVDASAYLALLLDEPGAAQLERLLRGGSLHSSVLLVLESTRNLIRVSRAGALPAERLQAALDRLRVDQEAFTLRAVDLEICSGLQMPVVSTPRTLDLVHLRTAQWFHRRAPLDGFVSLDRQQRQAARELDLPVWSA